MQCAFYTLCLTPSTGIFTICKCHPLEGVTIQPSWLPGMSKLKVSHGLHDCPWRTLASSGRGSTLDCTSPKHCLSSDDPSCGRKVKYLLELAMLAAWLSCSLHVLYAHSMRMERERYGKHYYWYWHIRPIVVPTPGQGRAWLPKQPISNHSLL